MKRSAGIGEWRRADEMPRLECGAEESIEFSGGAPP